MVKNLLAFFIVFTLCFSQSINQETGWSYTQSTQQSFFMFETIQINGQVAFGDGDGPQDDDSYCLQNEFSCDVVGAFFNDTCVGWVYANSAGWTTVPAMGYDSGLTNYPSADDLITFKIYDSSEGDYIDFSSQETICQLSSGGFSDECFWGNNNSIFLIYNYSFLDNEEIPSDFSLLSAYPNPFNPSVNIDFHIESNSLVNLKIYDMLGNLVDNLILGEFMSTGNHSATWAPNNVSAGEYIVSLSVDGFQLAVQKIAYIK